MNYLVSVQYEVKQEAENPGEALEKAIARILDAEVQIEYVNVWPQRSDKKESE